MQAEQEQEKKNIIPALEESQQLFYCHQKTKKKLSIEKRALIYVPLLFLWETFVLSHDKSSGFSSSNHLLRVFYWKFHEIFMKDEKGISPKIFSGTLFSGALFRGSAYFTPEASPFPTLTHTHTSASETLNFSSRRDRNLALVAWKSRAGFPWVFLKLLFSLFLRILLKIYIFSGLELLVTQKWVN